jgi:Ca2+-transporting ATPase
MMTGDHIATASEIAVQAGLAEDGRIAAFTEGDLQEIDPEDPKAGKGPDLLQANVFARVSPESKLKLVQFYQSAGHVVAMTGDGVNDAPALKKADIGIAMGQRGTQVAREAAAMVLKDDAFNSIIAAMRQGRVIFGNIRRFVIYLMSCNFSEVLVVGLAIIIGLPVPLSPIQILFLNIVTDVFPAFALGLGEGDETVMHQPPRDPKEQIVTGEHWLDIVVFGLLITAATLGAYWLALGPFGMNGPEATTIAFMTLALSQLWHVFNMREVTERWIGNTIWKNTYVWYAIVLCLLLLGGSFYIPALADVMALTLPGKDDLALAVGASLMPLLAGQIWIGVKTLRHQSRPVQKTGSVSR